MAGKPLADVTDHGGSLSRAAEMFPRARGPWLDLSTGINPFSYPLGALPATAFTRLPEAAEMRALGEAAARAYGAPGGGSVVAAPGTQILLPLVASLVPPGRAAILSPTYAEHARAAALAGHAVEEVRDIDALHDADLAVLVNPNNPDGRIVPRAELLALAGHLRGKGGLLVVDEAFMDVGPPSERLDGDVARGGMVVLRSFGKFFGLAGLRLGFAIAAPPLARALGARLGPWAVSGPALTVAGRALADLSWQEEMRRRLAAQAARLDEALARSGLAAGGGTALFRLVRTPDAQGLFRRLGEQGILVRRFDHSPDALRIGLPGGEEDFARLEAALSGARASN